MNTNDVLNTIYTIPIGTVVAWISAFAIIIGTLYAILQKLWKLFDRYDNIRDENERVNQKLEEYDKKFSNVEEKLETITDLLEEQRGTKIKELRNSIVHIAEAALRDGRMSVRAYTSLMEMYQEYTDKYHQNTYVKSLIEKVIRDVEVIGKLDEHGNDIL